MTETPWMSLSFDEISSLSVDDLAIRILSALGGGSAKRGHVVDQVDRHGGEAAIKARQAVAEAWRWLIANGLLAPDAQNAGNENHDDWWLATKLGREVAARPDGPSRLRAGARVGLDLHPAIAADVRAEFLRGKFETAVFTALKEVELALRRRSGLDLDDVGVQLVGKALGDAGPLRVPGVPDAEHQAAASLFRGALGAFKNPSSHRQVNYEDPTEAAEVVILASLLLRILDRMEVKEPPDAL